MITSLKDVDVQEYDYINDQYTGTTLYFQVDQKYVNNKTSASRTPKARQYFDFSAHVKFAPKANIF